MKGRFMADVKQGWSDVALVPIPSQKCQHERRSRGAHLQMNTAPGDQPTMFLMLHFR
jgi:hypothetical protein